VPSVPQPQVKFGLGVLTKRLVYVVDKAGEEALMVLDTSDATKVAPIANAPFDLPAGDVITLLATPQSASTIGGSVNVFSQVPTAACGPLTVDGGSVTACQVYGYHLNITNSGAGTFGAPVPVGKVTPGAPLGIVADLAAPRSEVILEPALSGLENACETDETKRTTKAGIQKYNPLDISARGGEVKMSFASDRAPSIAFDSCKNTLYVGAVASDPGIHVFPLDDDPGATPLHLCVGTSGQFLVEPFTNTFLRTAQFGDVEAYRIGGTRLAPTLTAAGRAVPANMVVTLMAVRAPEPCE
jgi:hypothetical protein